MSGKFRLNRLPHVRPDKDESTLVDEVQRTDSGGSTGSSTLTTSSRTSSNAAHQHMNEKMQTIRNINRRSRGSYTSIIAANGSDEFPSPSMGRRSSVLNINPQEEREEVDEFKNLEQGVMYDTGSPDDQTLDPVHEHEHSLDIESPGIFGRSYSTLDQDTTVGSPSSRTRSSPLDSRSSSSIRSNRSSSSSRRSSTLDRVSSTQKSLAESKQGTRGYYDRACSVGTDDMMGLLFHILELEDQLGSDSPEDTKKEAEVDMGILTDDVAHVFNKGELDTVIKFFTKTFGSAPDKHSKEMEMLERQRTEECGDRPEDGEVSSHNLLGRRARSSVICFGSIAMDLVTDTDMFPTANSHQKGCNLLSLPGGKGANEAVAIGRLGCHSYLIGRVGHEDFGRVIVTKIMEDVDVTGIIFDPKIATGLCMIIKCNGGLLRTTTSCLAANSVMGKPDVDNLSAILAKDKNVRLVIIDLNIEIDTAVDAAVVGVNAEKFVVVRPSAVQKAADFPSKLWEYTHILAANDFEAPILLGIEDAADNPYGISMPLKSLQQGAQAAELLMQTRPNLVAVIITTAFGNVCRMRMAAASRLHDSGASPSQPKDLVSHIDQEEFVTLVVPHFATKVVDAIGAADAFLGAICGGIAHGAPLPHAIVWGAAGAALSVLQPGAQSSMPTLDGLQEFLCDRGVGVHTDRMGPPTTQRHEGGKALIPRWLSSRPAVSEDIRELETLLHAGLYERFEKEAKKVFKRDPRALNQVIDFQGQTLLHLAVVYDDHPAMCTLLQCGAKFYLKDLYGKTPLDRCHEYQLCNKRLQNNSWNKLCLLAVAKADHFLRNADDTAPGEGQQARYHYPWEELQDLQELPVAFTETIREDDWASMLLGMILLPWIELEKSNNKKKIDAGVSKFFQPMLELAVHILDNMMDLSQRTVNTKRMSTIGRQLQGPITAEQGLSIRQHIARAQSKNMVRMTHAVAYSGKTSVLKKMCELLRPELEAELAEVAGNSPDLVDVLDYLATLDQMDMWFSAIDVHFTDHERRDSLHYAAIGHNATDGGCFDTVDLLLEWKLDPHAKDRHGLTALDYAQDPDIKRKMRFAGISHDAFISLGHTPETDEAVRSLVNELNELNISVWWDKGEYAGDQADDTGDLENGIRQGMAWTEEIESAMRHSKTCIVILTKKWLASQFCKAEALMALTYGKPIFTVLPPVSSVGLHNSAEFSDIPNTEAFKLIKFALGHRQNFDFRTVADAATLRTKTRELMRAIVKSEPEPPLYESEASPEFDVADAFRLMEPPNLRYGWGRDDYILVCSGADAPEGGYHASFAKLMSDTLRSNGFPIKQGLKQLCKAAGPTSSFWNKLMFSIDDAVIVVLLLEEDTDTQFLNKVAIHAGQKATKCIIVPYTTSNVDRVSGLNYSTNLLQFKTCCFTDWMGADGLTDKSPIFKQIFHEIFLRTADELADITRTRAKSVTPSRSLSSSFKIRPRPSSRLGPTRSGSDVSDASGPNNFSRSMSSGLAQAGCDDLSATGRSVQPARSATDPTAPKVAARAARAASDPSTLGTSVVVDGTAHEKEGPDATQPISPSGGATIATRPRGPRTPSTSTNGLLDGCEPVQVGRTGSLSAPATVSIGVTDERLPLKRVSLSVPVAVSGRVLVRTSSTGGRAGSFCFAIDGSQDGREAPTAPIQEALGLSSLSTLGLGSRPAASPPAPTPPAANGKTPPGKTPSGRRSTWL